MNVADLWDIMGKMQIKEAHDDVAHWFRWTVVSIMEMH
jgi:hypothetical protein